MNSLSSLVILVESNFPRCGVTDLVVLSIYIRFVIIIRCNDLKDLLPKSFSIFGRSSWRGSNRLSLVHHFYGLTLKHIQSPRHKIPCDFFLCIDRTLFLAAFEPTITGSSLLWLSAQPYEHRVTKFREISIYMNY